MGSESFYAGLPELGSFEQVFSRSNYHNVPEDWIIIVTDVVNSTEAIAAGKYKQVNIAGAVSLAVASNVVGSLGFPFTFGGDGVSMMLPPEQAERVLTQLQDLRTTVRNSFDLELRVGAVPVAMVARPDRPVRIAKLRVSHKYTQAVFDGAGLSYTEELVKTAALLEELPLAESGPQALLLEGSVLPSAAADTSGFSCRWREIPSDKGEVVALIVEACGSDPDLREAGIRRAAEVVRESVGSEEQFHPVAAGRQQMISTPEEIDNEALIHAGGRSGLRLLVQRTWVRLQLMAVRFVLWLKLPLRYNNKTLSKVEGDNITHADFRKYDGRLKMVLACSSEERLRLSAGLEALEAEGAVMYGMHVSDHSLITCVMHLRAPDEVHFIDGGNGGYTLAATQLKAKQCS